VRGKISRISSWHVGLGKKCLNLLLGVGLNLYAQYLFGKEGVHGYWVIFTFIKTFD
jgi:nucleoside-specific outer membrane channel protein Tsx